MKKLFLIIIFLLLQMNLVFSNTNIVFVDMEKIMSSSKPGSSILKQLNSLNDKNKEIFINEQEKLKKKENEIISKKNIISEKEIEIEISKLKKDIVNYNTKRNKMIANFNQLKVDSTNKLLQLINPILVKYSEENSIFMILNKKNLIMGKIEMDITSKIMNIVDSDIKVFKIK